MTRPTQRQGSGFGNTIRQGIQMLSGKNVDNYTLVFLDATVDQKSGGEQTIWNPFISLGRAKNCTIRYSEDYPTVSRRHAYIRLESGKYFLESDPNTTNPTLVNNQAVHNSQELHPGDEIRLSFEGPRLRFVHTPAHKTTASMKFSRRLSEFGSQALRPYKQAIGALSFLIIALAGFIFWNMNTLNSQNEKLKISMAGLSQSVAENEMAIDSALTIMPGVVKPIIESSIKDVLKARFPGAKPGVLPPSVADVNFSRNHIPSLRELEGSVYFIYITNVQVGHETSLKPFELDKDLSYSWSGTGFLLDDGRFITARHVIQPWRFNIKCGGMESADLDQQVKTYLNNVEITGGKVEITYVAISPSGDKFTFTNSDITMDKSKDILDCGAKDESEFGVKKCISYNTDWAFIKFNKRKGKFRMNTELSDRLPKGTELVGLGYSYGDYLQSNFKLEPLLIEGKVVQSKITNGVISISANAIAGGSSGGPILIKMADDSYEVIGIISHGTNQVQFLVPVSEIW